MVRRNKRRAVTRRRNLIAKLGGKCVECGAVGNLEIDHIEGRTWDIRSKGSDSRVAIYEREAEEGKLQILCKSCNSRKGAHGFPVITRNDKKKTKKGKP